MFNQHKQTKSKPSHMGVPDPKSWTVRYIIRYASEGQNWLGLTDSKSCVDHGKI